MQNIVSADIWEHVDWMKIKNFLIENRLKKNKQESQKVEAIG